MTDTNQLPEPELGYIQTDKSNQPAFSARQMREAMGHATQADVTDAAIDAVTIQQWGDQRGAPLQAHRAYARAILALRTERVPMTDAAREHFLRGYESAQQDALVCQLPPEGWACTRTAGHEGPCAAVPTDEGAFVKRGMDRLRESHNGITTQAKKETP